MSLPRYDRYRPSGVEWLGEIPEHWDVAALKRGYSVKLGKMLQPEAISTEDELCPYLRAANISWSGVDATDVKTMWFSIADQKRLTLLVGDLLVSEGGDVGRSAIWKGEIEGCYFQNSINRIRSNGTNSTKFLYYWMFTLKAKGFIDVLCNKSTIAHFTAEKVGSVPTPFPPPDEQIAIVNFLDFETAKIDALIKAMVGDVSIGQTKDGEGMVELLQERRSALISAAATGKIDVRSVALKSEAA